MQSHQPQIAQRDGAPASRPVTPAQTRPGPQVVPDVAGELALVADLAPAFLEWQCRMIAGVMRGAIFLPATDAGGGSLVARWPASGETSPVLEQTAAKALTSRASQLRAQVHYGGHQGQVCDALACPVIYEGRPVAVVSVALATRALPQQKAVQQLLEWGANWFATLLARDAQSRQRRAPLLLDLVSEALGKDNLQDMARTAVELLAARGEGERVSLAVTNGSKLKLIAVSGVPEFDERTRFATRLEDAMEEVADQGRSMQFPAVDNSSSLIDRAHRRMADANPNQRFYTTVASHGSERAALLVERDREQAFSPAQTAIFDDAAALLVQTTALRRAANGSIGSLVSRGRRGVKKSARGRAGLWALAAAVLVGLAALVPGTFRVTADAELISREQRAVVAPISGYVESTEVRPGDDVNEGDLLAALDTRDLRLERDKWRGLRGARQAEYQGALAKRDRTQISVLRARLRQIDAELAIVEAQMARSQMRAPYAGVIVSGDLSQALDAPVEQGQVLFQIAPLTAYRVVLEVNEYDVAAVGPGFEGRLRLAALPSQVIPFVVERVLPVAVSGDGQSYFRVEALLAEQPPELRPGMHGVAKVTAGRRSLLWLWTHALADRLRLFAWSLGL